MRIEIQRQIAVVDPSDIPSEEDMLTWAQMAFDVAGYHEDCSLTARFAEADEVHELNNTYRHVDRPTNILSFPFEQPEDIPEENGEVYLGDLVICMDVLRREAAEQHKTLKEHSAHLIIHGCLHLLGFDHITDEEAQEMEGLEIKILEKLGYENPYKDDEI